MPRVLIAGFCAVPGPDRAGVQLTHFIGALARHHTVDVLVVRRGDQAYVEKMAGARILRVPVPGGSMRTRIDAFRRALRRQLEGADYDVVHVRDGWAGIPVLETRGRLKYAIVFDAGRSPLAEPPIYDLETATQLERDELECVRRSDMVLVATEPARRSLEPLTAPERLRLVPPGVDVDLFDWDTPPAPPPRILYIGALMPGRGVRVLLRAMLDIAAQSDARLVLAGRASHEFFASLETAVHDLNLDGRVQLLGEIAHDDVPAVIASATVCVAPGAADLGPRHLALYPTKLLEYMACQRAVVAPRRGTVTMFMRDEQHGLLFEPGKPLDLAQQILRLLGDPELRGRLARSGYELVRRAHTASATRRDLRRAYAWLGSISPWRERFAALLEELPTGNMPSLASANPTGASGAWMQGRPAGRGERPIAAFEADLLADELTESGAGDTGVEALGEVTKVETSPLLPDEERTVAAYSAGGTAVDTSVASVTVDEWVVDDSRIRDQFPAVGGEHDGEPAAPHDCDAAGAHPRSGRDEHSASTPVDAHFVAGEFEVRSPPSSDTAETRGSAEERDGEAVQVEMALDPLDAPDASGAFTAMSPPLGFGTGPSDIPDGDAAGDVRPVAPVRVPPPLGDLPPARSRRQRRSRSDTGGRAAPEPAPRGAAAPGASSPPSAAGSSPSGTAPTPAPAASAGSPAPPPGARPQPQPQPPPAPPIPPASGGSGSSSATESDSAGSRGLGRRHRPLTSR